MADVTITGLPNATTPLGGTERVPMDQDGATKDATTQDIANLAGAAITSAINTHEGAGDPHPGYALESALPTFPSGAIVGTTDAQTLTSKTLGDLKESVFTVSDGASVDLDPADGPIQVWTLGDNRTPTAASFAAGQSMALWIADGTAYSVTWTTIGVVWGGGSAPTLATTGYTVVELVKVGSTVYGFHVGDVA